MADCEHKRTAPAICDQTIGIVCLDCNKYLHVEWMEDHIPVPLWNEAIRQAKERGDEGCEDWKPAEPKVCWRCHEPGPLFGTRTCPRCSAFNPKWEDA